MSDRAIISSIFSGLAVVTSPVPGWGTLVSTIFKVGGSILGMALPDEEDLDPMHQPPSRQEFVDAINQLSKDVVNAISANEDSKARAHIVALADNINSVTYDGKHDLGSIPWDRGALDDFYKPVEDVEMTEIMDRIEMMGVKTMYGALPLYCLVVTIYLNYCKVGMLQEMAYALRLYQRDYNRWKNALEQAAPSNNPPKIPPKPSKPLPGAGVPGSRSDQGENKSHLGNQAKRSQSFFFERLVTEQKRRTEFLEKATVKAREKYEKDLDVQINQELAKVVRAKRTIFPNTYFVVVDGVSGGEDSEWLGSEDAAIKTQAVIQGLEVKNVFDKFNATQDPSIVNMSGDDMKMYKEALKGWKLAAKETPIDDPNALNVK